MSLAAAETIAVASCQTLALRVGSHGIIALRLTHNGTAVEGVCVTGAASRFLVPVVSREAVPVASRYGAIFASPGERKKCHLCSLLSRAGSHGSF
jgi:hypothetical protein